MNDEIPVPLENEEALKLIQLLKLIIEINYENNK